MKFKLGMLCYVSSSLFIMVYSDPQQDYYNNCRRACNIDLLPNIISLINSSSLAGSEYKTLEPYWQTCQYRCYRCYLPDAITGMKYIKKLFAIKQQNKGGSLVEIARIIDKLDSSFRQCYENWEKANNEGNYESTF